MSSAPAPASPLLLRTLRGPHAVETPLGRDLLIGRSIDADVRLDHPRVSRRHARVLRIQNAPHLVDLGSLVGTRLNGVQIPPERPLPLHEGDVVAIGPWLLRIAAPGRGGTTFAHGEDDPGTSVQRLVAPGRDVLGVLVEALASLPDARTDGEIAAAVVRVAARSGIPRVAYLRPAPDGRLACLARSPEDGPEPAYSRSLLSAAVDGQPVVLTARHRETRHSIADLGITAAVAVPVTVGESVEGVLYLDARGTERPLTREQTRLAEALAAAASLALAERRRADLDLRQRSMAADLETARDVQRGIFAPGSGRAGPWRWAMRAVPGSYIAGDLFELVELPGGRVAMALGDVTGHGVGAGLGMAVVQAYLRAQLEFLEDPADAVNALNGYIAGRLPGGGFVSLFVALLEPDGHARVIDAGHGHAVLLSDGTPRPLGLRGGPPVGIDAACVYAAETLTVRDGETLVAYTDGITDQAGPAGDRLGPQGFAEALAGARDPADAVERAHAAADRFAAGTPRGDDATVAAARYSAPKPRS